MSRSLRQRDRHSAIQACVPGVADPYPLGGLPSRAEAETAISFYGLPRRRFGGRRAGQFGENRIARIEVKHPLLSGGSRADVKPVFAAFLKHQIGLRYGKRAHCAIRPAEFESRSVMKQQK